MQANTKTIATMGLFEVMGYQKIIDNNQIIDVTKIISETLMKLPEKTYKSMLPLPKEIASFSQGRLKKMQTLIFSDTILLVFPFDPELDLFARATEYLLFFIYTAYFLRTAFDSGLPLRGAIDSGEYVIARSDMGSCFAGQPIIEAYRLSTKLQFSGCVLTNHFYSQLKTDLKQDEALRKENLKLFLSYLVPLKKNEEERMGVINWLCPFGDWTIPDDLRQYVIRAFHRHSKDVPRNVIPKIENTEIMLRYFKDKFRE